MARAGLKRYIRMVGRASSSARRAMAKVLQICVSTPDLAQGAPRSDVLALARLKPKQRRRSDLRRDLRSCFAVRPVDALIASSMTSSRAEGPRPSRTRSRRESPRRHIVFSALTACPAPRPDV